jgi:hypothetical protein
VAQNWHSSGFAGRVLTTAARLSRDSEAVIQAGGEKLAAKLRHKPVLSRRPVSWGTGDLNFRKAKVTLAPRDHRLDESEVASLPSIRIGNLALRIHVVEGATDRTVQASILNLALRNEIR